MLEKEVHSAVVRWLRDLLPCPVIKAYQAGKVFPEEPYVWVHHVTTREVRQNAQGEDYEEDSSGEVTASAPIETEWFFSVHCFGEGGMDILRPLRSAVQLPQKCEPLMPYLIPFEVGELRNVPDFENAKWESRAQMDLRVRGVVRDGFVVDVIEEYSFGISQTNRDSHT